MRYCAILTAGVLTAILGFARQPSKPSRPDVFLITIDTLRADHVHCYGDGNIQTPALDSLAKEGIRFTQAFTPSPLTNSSHTTIMTGLLPSHHGVTDFGVALDASHPTLAEILKKQGYETAAFIGSIILDSKALAPGLDHGFDFYDHFPTRSRSPSRWGRVERRGMTVVQHAETWLNAYPAGPHLVWVHLYDPHDPYEPPAPYSTIYKDRLYDGEIAYADSALGHFISYLKRRGEYANALIVVVGDHGEGLGEHGEQTHGIFLYDSTTHVPLIMKLPQEQPGNREIDAQVRTTDILPTILDVLQLQEAAPFDGSSLKSYFDGTETSGRPLFGETNYPVSFGWAPLRSVREEGFKFIEAPRPEFYNLGSDPKETTTLYAPWNPIVLKMRAELSELREKFPIAETTPGAVGRNTTDELQALGYLHPSDGLTRSNVPQPSLLPDPKDKIAEFNLLHIALLEADASKLADSRASLEKVLQLDPTSPAALAQLGWLSLKTSNYQQAADYWKRADEVTPDNAEILFNYGTAQEFSGNLPGAIKALNASLKIDPAQYGARVLLGKIYFNSHNLESAQDQVEAAILIRPTFEANFMMAKILLAEKKYAAAIERLKSLIGQRKESVEVYDSIAKAYLGLNNQEAAQRARNEADRLRRRDRTQ